MKLKFLIFLLCIAAIVTGLMIFESKREPAKFSDVLFSYLDLSHKNVTIFNI